MRRDPSLAEQDRRLRHQDRCAESRIYSMQDAARTLDLSRSRVWQLAVAGELAYEPTTGGQFIFHEADLQKYLVDRAERLARTRPQQLRVLHLRMAKAEIEPRQIQFRFMGPKPRIRLVESGERSIDDRGTKAADTGPASRESNNRSFVNLRGRAGQVGRG